MNLSGGGLDNSDNEFGVTAQVIEQRVPVLLPGQFVYERAVKVERLTNTEGFQVAVDALRKCNECTGINDTIQFRVRPIHAYEQRVSGFGSGRPVHRDAVPPVFDFRHGIPELSEQFGIYVQNDPEVAEAFRAGIEDTAASGTNTTSTLGQLSAGRPAPSSSMR